jgi:hypothetical protein
VSKVPGVGWILGALVELLWPQSANNNVTWDQMQAYVEQEINQAIDQATKERLDAELTGLSGVLHNYEIALQDPSNPAFISSNFVSALNHLTHSAPAFSPTTRPYLVLTQYAQIYNLLINQLREGILHGASWGIPQAAITDYQNQLVSRIQQGTQYVTAQLAAAHQALAKPANNNKYNVNLFNNNAALDLAMVPGTLDQSYYWPYMNPATYPDPVDPKNTRTLFTPAYSYMTNNGTPVVNSAPQPEVTKLRVWGGDAIDALEVTINGGAAKKYGGTGGSLNPPKGGTFVLGPATGSAGRITRVFGYSGDKLDALGLVLTNNGAGTTVPVMGNANKPQSFSEGLPDEFVGSIQPQGAIGANNGPTTVASTTFGFRLADSY